MNARPWWCTSHRIRTPRCMFYRSRIYECKSRSLPRGTATTTAENQELAALLSSLPTDWPNSDPIFHRTGPSYLSLTFDFYRTLHYLGDAISRLADSSGFHTPVLAFSARDTRHNFDSIENRTRGLRIPAALALTFSRWALLCYVCNKVFSFTFRRHPTFGRRRPGLRPPKSGRESWLPTAAAAAAASSGSPLIVGVLWLGGVFLLATAAVASHREEYTTSSFCHLLSTRRD